MYDYQNPYRLPQAQPLIPESERKKLGFWGGVGDVAAAIPRGAVGAVQSAYGLTDSLLGDALPDWNDNPLGESQTMVGQFAESISQFAVGFAAGGAVLKGVGLASKLGTAGTTVAKGVFADLAAFDGHDQRISNLIQGTSLQNPVTEFLAADEEDPELLARTKAAIEGVALGGVMDSMIVGLRRLRKGRKARSEGKDIDGVVEAMDEVETSQDLAGRSVMMVTAQGTTQITGRFYHGASKTISGDLLADYPRRSKDQGIFGTGVYLSSSKDVASFYSGMNDGLVYDVPVKLNNVLVIGPDKKAGAERAAKELGVTSTPQWDGMQQTSEQWSREFTEKARRAGYDGAVWKGSDDTYEVVSYQDVPLVEASTETPTTTTAVKARLHPTEEHAVELRSRFLRNLEEGVEVRPSGQHNIAKWDREGGAVEMVRAYEETFADIDLDGIVKTRGRTLAQVRQESLGRLRHMLNKDEALINEAILSEINQASRTLHTVTRKALAMEMVLMDRMAYTGELATNLASSGDLGAHIRFVNFMEETEQLSRTLQGFKTTLGQSLGNLRIYKSLPDGFSDLLRKKPEAIKAIGEVADDADMKAFQDFAKKISDAYGEGGLEGNRAVLDILEDPMHTRLLRVTTEYWMNSILSGPQTFTVNFFSGLTMSVYEPMERIAGGAGLEPLREIMGLMQTFRESMKWGYESFKTGDAILHPRTKFDSVDDVAFKASSFGLDKDSLLGSMADWVGHHIVRFPGRVLTGTDEFIKQMNYRAQAWAKFSKEGLEKGMSPTEAADHARREISNLIKEGQAYSFNSLFKEGMSVAAERQLGQDDALEFALEYVKDNFDEELGTLSKTALGAAERRTFTNPLGAPDQGMVNESIDNLAKLAQSGAQKVPLLKFFAPFVRTPTNILKYSLNRTPVVTLPGATEALAVKMKLPKFEKARSQMAKELLSDDKMVQQVARGKLAASISVMALIYQQTHLPKPFITGGGPRKKEDRDAMIAAGWQPYSVRVGDTYVSYRRLDPFATMLGLVADVSDYFHYADPGAQERERGTILATALMTSVFRQMHEKTFLTGISTLTRAAEDPENYGPRLLEQLGGSFVPSMAGQAVQATDPYQREVRGVLDAMLARIPEFNETLEVRRDVLGEPMRRTRGLGSDTVGDWANWIMPLKYTETTDSKIRAELATLRYGFEPPSSEYRGHDLLSFRSSSGQTAYDRWSELQGKVRINGKTLQQSLTQMMQSEQYQALSPESTEDIESPRIQLVRRVLNAYRRSAMKQTMSEYDELAAAERTRRINTSLVKRGANPLSFLQS